MQTNQKVKQLFPLTSDCSRYVSKQDWEREKEPSFECEECLGITARFTTPSTRAKYGEIELTYGKRKSFHAVLPFSSSNKKNLQFV
jgi:hypothetical protein